MLVINRRERLFLAAVFIYSFIPTVVGLLRIPELLGGPEIGPANPRAATNPSPIILHILASSIFCLAGAVQFLPSLRRHRPNSHRRLGRIVAVAACVSALTGLWMTVAYTFPPALQGPLLYWARIVLSLAMVALTVWAVAAIRSGAVMEHRAAMLRAYAIGQGASTQTVLFVAAMALMGVEVLGFSRDVLMVLAWVINLALAELLIRRVRGSHTAHAAIGPS